MIKMKLKFFLICVFLTIATMSADAAPNPCFQEKMRPINDAAGNFEDDDPSYYFILRREAAKSAEFICATFEKIFEKFKRKKYSDLTDRRADVVENLECYKAALKIIKPESSLIGEQDPNCNDDKKVQEIIDAATEKFNNDMERTIRTLNTLNLTFCGRKEWQAKESLVTGMYLERLVFSNSEFDEDKQVEELKKLLVDHSTFAEFSYECALREVQKQ